MARFLNATDCDIENIIKEKDAENTKKVTEIFVNVLKSYCRENKINFDIKTISKEDLATILVKFYVEVRKTDGSPYKLTSFRSMRFALQREFKVICGHEFDIIMDKEFSKANVIFKAQTVKLKREGLAKVSHHPPISNDDLKKLYASKVFSVNHPVSLQRKIFFDVIYYFCRRERENLRLSTIDDFSIKVDSNGNEYIEKVSDELTKNHREDHENEDVMIIEGNGSINCPVISFKLYISKLNPKLKALFQRPNKKIPTDDSPWYDNMVVGERGLGDMMKVISKEAELSRVYTNHSIRATTISILNSNGVEGRDIVALSGHRSITSLQSYCKTSNDRKRAMSQMLSAAVQDRDTDNVASTSYSSRSVSFNMGVNIPDIPKTQNHVFNFEGCEVNIYTN